MRTVVVRSGVADASERTTAVVVSTHDDCPCVFIQGFVFAVEIISFCVYDWLRSSPDDIGSEADQEFSKLTMSSSVLDPILQPVCGDPSTLRERMPR